MGRRWKKHKQKRGVKPYGVVTPEDWNLVERSGFTHYRDNMFRCDVTGNVVTIMEALSEIRDSEKSGEPDCTIAIVTGCEEFRFAKELFSEKPRFDRQLVPITRETATKNTYAERSVAIWTIPVSEWETFKELYLAHVST